MRLGIVYHMPFWQAADGSLWEAEGSFARYVDSLAPYFDEVSLAVPVGSEVARGTRLHAPNVRLAPLPHFDGPRQFYPRLGEILRRLSRWIRDIDVLHCRVPTPAAFPAFVLARRRTVPTFLLVVGDLRGVLPTLPYRGIKRAMFGAYTACDEWAVQHMVERSLTFANGGPLASKHRRPHVRVCETKTTTIAATDIANRPDTCQRAAIRLLTVSRIDPRKGLRCLPAALAALVARGHDVRLDIIGPDVGKPGEEERAAIVSEARRLGLADRLAFLGSIPLDWLLPMYRQYDLFVLPTGPGEGIPRVLLEAMAAGLPIVTTAVAGIPSLVSDEMNGLFINESSGSTVATAVGRLIDDAVLRQRLIQHGYQTARAHTLEVQAKSMMDIVSSWLGADLRRKIA